MPYVYRYVDRSDGVTKYIGIIKKESNFPGRFEQHKNDWWARLGEFDVYYIEVETVSDAEALEGHFISVYGTEKYYNKSKTKWGPCSFAPEEYSWVQLQSSVPKDNTNEQIQELAERVSKLEAILNREEKREYFKELGLDVVKEFLQAKTEKSKYSKIKRGLLYSEFLSYCALTNYPHRIGKIKFYEQMREMGFPETKDGRGDYFWNIKIKEAE